MQIFCKFCGKFYINVHETTCNGHEFESTETKEKIYIFFQGIFFQKD